MNELKLWEIDEKKNYIFFNDIKKYLLYLEEHNRALEFVTKDSYTLGSNTENILDIKALYGKFNFIYTDNNHPIAIARKKIYPSFANPNFLMNILMNLKYMLLIN